MVEVMESMVLSASISSVWNWIKHFDVLLSLGSQRQPDTSAWLVGTSRTVEYKDQTVHSLAVLGLSDYHHRAQFEQIPPACPSGESDSFRSKWNYPYMSCVHIIQLLPVTSSNATFIEFRTEYTLLAGISSSNRLKLIDDSRSEKQAVFNSLVEKVKNNSVAVRFRPSPAIWIDADLTGKDATTVLKEGGEFLIKINEDQSCPMLIFYILSPNENKENDSTSVLGELQLRQRNDDPSNHYRVPFGTITNLSFMGKPRTGYRGSISRSELKISGKRLIDGQTSEQITISMISESVTSLETWLMGITDVLTASGRRVEAAKQIHEPSLPIGYSVRLVSADDVVCTGYLNALSKTKWPIRQFVLTKSRLLYTSPENRTKQISILLSDILQIWHRKTNESLAFEIIYKNSNVIDPVQANLTTKMGKAFLLELKCDTPDIFHPWEKAFSSLKIQVIMVELNDKKSRKKKIRTPAAEKKWRQRRFQRRLAGSRGKKALEQMSQGQVFLVSGHGYFTKKPAKLYTIFHRKPTPALYWCESGGDEIPKLIAKTLNNDTRALAQTPCFKLRELQSITLNPTKKNCSPSLCLHAIDKVITLELQPEDVTEIKSEAESDNESEEEDMGEIVVSVVGQDGKVDNTQDEAEHKLRSNMDQQAMIEAWFAAITQILDDAGRDVVNKDPKVSAKKGPKMGFFKAKDSDRDASKPSNKESSQNNEFPDFDWLPDPHLMKQYSVNTGKSFPVECAGELSMKVESGMFGRCSYVSRHFVLSKTELFWRNPGVGEKLSISRNKIISANSHPKKPLRFDILFVPDGKNSAETEYQQISILAANEQEKRNWIEAIQRK